MKIFNNIEIHSNGSLNLIYAPLKSKLKTNFINIKKVDDKTMFLNLKKHKKNYNFKSTDFQKKKYNLI